MDDLTAQDVLFSLAAQQEKGDGNEVADESPCRQRCDCGCLGHLHIMDLLKQCSVNGGAGGALSGFSKVSDFHHKHNSLIPPRGHP